MITGSHFHLPLNVLPSSPPPPHYFYARLESNFKAADAIPPGRSAADSSEIFVRVQGKTSGEKKEKESKFSFPAIADPRGPEDGSEEGPPLVDRLVNKVGAIIAKEVGCKNSARQRAALRPPTLSASAASRLLLFPPGWNLLPSGRGGSHRARKWRFSIITPG